MLCGKTDRTTGMIASPGNENVTSVCQPTARSNQPPT
jgi:hypothetical protein